ncbi:MAG: type I restriction enzyme HsdR N-terminal domain-containing protein [Myxococcales bacterium]|nr:type I restriction enzyme HsdR N-terminal domain-containing protein [Myxococcales bacterium]
MDLADQLQALAARIPKQTEHLQTEAATSTALVMPFIAALGYNVFDPTEVVPEFTADVGTKKGEKVDYAIKRDGKPVILIEVKCWNMDLNAVHASQLFRYFTVTEARFGILTNGIQYKFFTDLEEPNKMDERPFFEFEMTDLKPQVLDALKAFARSKFDVENLVSAAGELKYTKGILRAISEEFHDPSEELVRYFAKRVYSGNLTKSAREQFTDIVRRAFQQFITERINERLKSALAKEETAESSPVERILDQAHDDGSSEIETTPEEVEGFNMVRAIASQTVAPERVVMRDAKSYCSVLLDDNNRKPICRLRFNAKQKYIGLFDAEKNEERVPIDALTDIFKHAEKIKATLRAYEHPEPTSAASAEAQ